MINKTFLLNYLNSKQLKPLKPSLQQFSDPAAARTWFITSGCHSSSAAAKPRIMQLHWQQRPRLLTSSHRKSCSSRSSPRRCKLPKPWLRRCWALSSKKALPKGKTFRGWPHCKRRMAHGLLKTGNQDQERWAFAVAKWKLGRTETSPFSILQVFCNLISKHKVSIYNIDIERSKY